ncbi:MAG TPA: tetratricopeptide repeat protein, partial [Salinimicrobium sp.]|nr:tetratricopeptide repeat protein [Salinimicrobium sp.]
MKRFFIFLFIFFPVFFGFAQSKQLAENYFEKGEFEKALNIYEKLLTQNPNDPEIFFALIASHQQLEHYSEAEKLLLNMANNSANVPTVLVELGHNYELQENREKSQFYYREALKAIEARPNFAAAIARNFEKYSLLDEAVKAYEIGMRLNPDVNYNIQLARLYGEQGEIEKMLSNYIDLIEKNPNFLPAASRVYSQFITEDPQNEANIIFRKLLLKKLQENQEILFNEMLSWLFIQQNEFKKAFLQEKAIYNRSDSNLSRIIQLAVMSKEKDPETSMEVLDFIVENSASEDLKLQAHQIKLNILQEKAEKAELADIEKQYREILETYGSGLNTISLQIDFANFLSFSREKPEEGIQLLNQLLEKQPQKFEEAAAK